MLLTQNAVEAQRGAGAIHLTTHCQPENDAVLAELDRFRRGHYGKRFTSHIRAGLYDKSRHR